MIFKPPACEDCRNSTRGYDALLCAIGVMAKTAQTNRDTRGICTPAGLKFVPKVKK